MENTTLKSLRTKFLKEVKQNFETKDYDMISKALQFATEKHTGQKRHNGDEYITHPIGVAQILLELNSDYETICAGLLHDTIEDTETAKDDIAKTFNPTIADLVVAVTKVKSLTYNEKLNESAENLRKMFTAMANDVRVILIKSADRLHNMRSLEFVSLEHKIRKSKETMEIYVPLLERLGIFNIKTELEDLAFKYLQPKEYEMVDQDLKTNHAKYNKELKSINEKLKLMLSEINMEGEVSSRIKSKYSIYRKLQKLHGEKIYDILAHRVIVNNIKDCYQILGEVNSRWRPLAGKVKDYIAAPKPNGYRSIHTTLLSENGFPFEVQIRTAEMHHTCEFGVAAHWKYKSGGGQGSDLDNRLNFLRQTIEDTANIKDSNKFLSITKSEIYTSEIFTFTPNHKVIELPSNATPIDFAYMVHSGIGDSCVGAKVNDKMVPLNTKLKTGDVVEIITSKQSKGPSRDWLNIVKTSSARNRIKNFFKRTMKDENIKFGKDMLEIEAKRLGKSLNSYFSDNDLVDKVLDKWSYDSLEDMFASVGYGAISAHQMLSRFDMELNKKEKKNRQISPKNNVSNTWNNIEIRGVSDVYTRLAKCCSPIPGDEIIGFISHGKGITVHRADCKNVLNSDSERLIKVFWKEDKKGNYNVNLQIDAVDGSALINRITTVIANIENVTLAGLNATATKEKATIIIKVTITEKNKIQELINKLSVVDGVLAVYRM